MRSTAAHVRSTLVADTTGARRARIDPRRPLILTLSTLLWALWSGVNPPGQSSDAEHRSSVAVAQSLSIGGTSTGSVTPTVDPRLRTPHPNVAALTDEQIAERLIGRWTTLYHGTQTIEKQADGTARLEIVFDWVAAFFYGERMRLDLRWKVENGVLTNHIERGEPQDKVAKLIADYEAECSYLVLELATDTLLLQEIDDPDSFHRWTRLR